MEIRLNPYDAVEEGSGDGVIVKVGVDVTTGVKLMVGVEGDDDVKVDETGVSDGAHAFTTTIRRTSLGNDVSFFKILSPLDGT